MDRENFLEKLKTGLASSVSAKSMVAVRAERGILRQSGTPRFEIDAERVRETGRHDGWHGVIASFTETGTRSSRIDLKIAPFGA